MTDNTGLMYLDDLRLGKNMVEVYKTDLPIWFMRYHQIASLLGGTKAFCSERFQSRYSSKLFRLQYKNVVWKISGESRFGARLHLYPSYIAADIIVWQSGRYCEEAMDLLPHFQPYFMKGLISTVAATNFNKGLFIEKG